jgi:hypothetical protein
LLVESNLSVESSGKGKIVGSNAMAACPVRQKGIAKQYYFHGPISGHLHRGRCRREIRPLGGGSQREEE